MKMTHQIKDLFRPPALLSILGLSLMIFGCAGVDPKVNPASVRDESAITILDMPETSPGSGIAGGDVPGVSVPEKSYERPFQEKGGPETTPKIALGGLTVENRPMPVNLAPVNRMPGGTARSGDAMDRQSSGQGETITLNFDNADIYEVIRTMAEILQVNYIVDPAVQGAVTIHMAGKLSKSDLFAVFSQILDANGLTATREGGIYRIGKSADAAKRPIPLYLPSRSGRDLQGSGIGDNVIMQIIPLKNIDSAEMAKLLTPFLSADGTIVSHNEPNILILVDKSANITKAMRLVDAIDIDVFHDLKQKFYPLKYTNAEEVVKVLDAILSAYGNDVKKNDVKVIAISRLNMLLVISANLNVFRQMDGLVRRLDVPNENVESRIYVYFVKNGEASELAGLLMNVFQQATGKSEPTVKSDGGEKQTSPAPINPFPSRIATQDDLKMKKSPEEPLKIGDELAGAPEAEPGSKSVKGDIRIIPDLVRNALIIDARPSDYQIVENILRRIDVLPRQVLIEATIAEVTLDGSMELGVEWSFDRANNNPTGLLTANIGESGLNYVIGLTDKWTQALNALAKDSKVNILSAPTVLASDNKQAQINVSTQIPLATTQFQYNAAETNPIFETTIQYRNTGIILTVTGGQKHSHRGQGHG